MTFDEAMAARRGDMWHHVTRKNKDGTPLRARVNGKVQVRVRSETWYLPMKHGLRVCFYIGSRPSAPPEDWVKA